MAAQAQTASQQPDRSFRWLVAPAVGAILAAAATLWQRRIQPSALTPVSEEWLRAQDVRDGRTGGW